MPRRTKRCGTCKFITAFRLGRLLGPGTRVWTEDEINEWLASRPVEISEQARRRAKASIEARRANGKLHTARQMLHGAA